jgi:hypothetical protein
VDHLTMSFYKGLDIGNDGVWDVWQLERPNMVWYFRGAPHSSISGHFARKPERPADAAPGSTPADIRHSILP